VSLLSVCIHYQAMPPDCEFYERLRTDRPLALLVASVFQCGSGLMYLYELPDDEIDEVVEFTLERYPDDFGRGPRVRRDWVNRLRVEIESARAAYPGIEQRSAWLMKPAWDIDRRLGDRFQILGAESAGRLADRLLFGESTLCAPLIKRGEECVGVLSAASLRVAATTLRHVRAEELFPEEVDRDGWNLDQTRDWIEFHVEAAGRHEDVLSQVI
jgi:hypothetical protein